MENTELIKALKEDAEWAHANEWETPITLGDHLDAAADLIESLQAQLADYPHMDQLVNGKMAENQRLRRINEKLQANLAESQRREREAVKDILCRDHCDVCVSGKEHEGECKIADYDCQTCKSATCRCRECRNEDKWQWRGPQEAGKGGGSCIKHRES